MYPKKNVLVITLSTLFIVLIGITIYFMESSTSYMMGFVLIPAILTINYFLIKKVSDSSEINLVKSGNTLMEPPIYRWKDKNYCFSSKSLFLFVLGSFIISGLLFIFFALDINIWIQEIVTKQTNFILSGIFHVPSEITFKPTASMPWYISVPGGMEPFGIGLFCTAVHVFCIFIGFIMSIPPSLYLNTRRDFLWRKIKALALLITLIYVINLVRMVILLYLTYLGFDFVIAHSILMYLTGVAGAVIFIFVLYKWLPELYIASYNICSNVSQFLKNIK